MTASVIVYEDNPSNTVLFDSSKSTIPTLFKTQKFTYSDIVVTGSGNSAVGNIYISGLKNGVHHLLPTYSDNVNASKLIKNQTSSFNFGFVKDGVVEISSGMLFYLNNTLKPTYPTANYFFRILEVH